MFDFRTLYIFIVGVSLLLAFINFKSTKKNSYSPTDYDCGFS